MTFGPGVRVTVSFCRQTRIHPFAVFCQHTHKSFLAAIPEQFIPFALTNLPSKPSCADSCLWEREGSTGAGAEIWSSGSQALPHTSWGARAHTQVPQGCHPWAISQPGVELLLSPQSRDSWFFPAFYCLSVGKAPTCLDGSLWVSRTVLAVFAPFPAASFVQALALISAQCCELLSLCEVSWRMGYPRQEYTDDF